MKAKEYFRRALQDPAFRRQKLDDLGYLRTVTLGLVVLVGLLGAAIGGLACWEEGWKAAYEAVAVTILPTFLLCGWNYSRVIFLLAALEAMDGPVTPHPSGDRPPMREHGP